MKTLSTKFKGTTYAKNDIALFLNRDYPYAATCWGADMVKEGDRVDVFMAERWFKRYFPSNVNQMVFRQMQATCVGQMEMA